MATAICRDLKGVCRIINSSQNQLNKVSPLLFCLVRTISGVSKLGPRDLLKEKTKKNELLRDELQMQIAESLQEVFENIKTYKPVEPGFFDKLMKKKHDKPKGLYIYGAVGMSFLC